MKDAITVLSTVSTKKEGQKIAKALVGKKLAACVQIVPGLESHYTWKNKLCCEQELLLIIKSRKKLFSKLKQEIQKNHSYEVAQIVALPIILGHKPYLKWMKSCLRSK